MTDCVRLYVFSEHNYVREEDYRAVLEQRQGFENAALVNETAAKKAKSEVEDLEVAWELLKGDMRSLIEIRDHLVVEALEAGRREGLEEAHEACIGAGSHLAAYRIRALIDSPEVE